MARIPIKLVNGQPVLANDSAMSFQLAKTVKPGKDCPPCPPADCPPPGFQLYYIELYVYSIGAPEVLSTAGSFTGGTSGEGTTLDVDFGESSNNLNVPLDYTNYVVYLALRASLPPFGPGDYILEPGIGVTGDGLLFSLAPGGFFASVVMNSPNSGDVLTFTPIITINGHAWPISQTLTVTFTPGGGS